jgi:hypothetical protein
MAAHVATTYWRLPVLATSVVVLDTHAFAAGAALSAAVPHQRIASITLVLLL